MPRKYPDTVLVLNLHRKWFDMILSGEKIEEYREIKPYWLKRLFLCEQFIYDDWVRSAPVICADLKNGEPLSDFAIKPYPYTQVHFNNGMKPDSTRPQMRCEIHPAMRISIGYGQEKWGATPGKLYFIIYLNGWVNAKNV